MAASCLLLTNESDSISLVIRAKRLPSMVNRRHELQKLTYQVTLPGGQQRLKELVLYVAEKSDDVERFGRIKLNKILWKSDFTAFKERGVPVSGRAYQRLEFGPAPVEMSPILAEMAQDGLIEWKTCSFGISDDGKEIIERRPIAKVGPVLRYFSSDDLTYVDAAIDYYRYMTGTETSDDSHGIAWKSRCNGDLMPYESAFFSDREPNPAQFKRIIERGIQRGWKTL